MVVQSLELHNIGRFDHLKLNIASRQQHQSNVTILISNNGSGKTTIVQALVRGLSWAIARIKTKDGSSAHISDLMIKNGKSFGGIAVTANSYRWTLIKAAQGKNAPETSKLAALSSFVENYRDRLTNNEPVELPLITFYSGERAILDIPKRIKKDHNFDQLDAYDEALSNGVDFRRFFEWFRQEEDVANQQEAQRLKELFHSQAAEAIAQNILDSLKPGLQPSKESRNELVEKIRKQLQVEAVNIKHQVFTQALEAFTGFTNLRIERKPLQMLIDKDGEPLNILQLSQGEQSLLALVADITRRLIMLNPHLDNPLEGSGIVIIDEAELHLHPNWQRSLVGNLTRTFPNCQFVLSTHSPLILSECEHALVYSLNDEPNNDGTLEPIEAILYGQDVHSVLLEHMGGTIRNQEVQQQLDNLYDLIDDDQFEQAHTELARLEQVLGNNPELNIAKFTLIRREKRANR